MNEERCCHVSNCKSILQSENGCTLQHGINIMCPCAINCWGLTCEEEIGLTIPYSVNKETKCQ